MSLKEVAEIGMVSGKSISRRHRSVKLKDPAINIKFFKTFKFRAIILDYKTDKT